MAVTAGRAWDVRPDLAHGGIVIVGWDHAARALQGGRLAVRSGLTQAQDELDVVLYDAVWLVGFSEGGAGSPHFGGRVCDLVPEDRGQALEPHLAAMDEGVGVEWDHLVLAETPASAAHVAHHHAQPAAGDEDAKALAPDPV